MRPLNSPESPTFTRARAPKLARGLGVISIASSVLAGWLASGCSEVLGDFEIETNGLTPEELGPQSPCELGAVTTGIVRGRPSSHAVWGRDGFDTVAECGGLGCNAATVACHPAACARNERRCQGSRLEVCNDALSDFTLLESCGSEALCVPVGNSERFRCDAPACAAGSAECQDNGDLAVCNADLTGFDIVNCGLLGCADRTPPECRTLGDLFGN